MNGKIIIKALLACYGQLTDGPINNHRIMGMIKNGHIEHVNTDSLGRFVYALTPAAIDALASENYMLPSDAKALRFTQSYMPGFKCCVPAEWLERIQ